MLGYYSEEGCSVYELWVTEGCVTDNLCVFSHLSLHIGCPGGDESICNVKYYIHKQTYMLKQWQTHICVEVSPYTCIFNCSFSVWHVSAKTKLIDKIRCFPNDLVNSPLFWCKSLHLSIICRLWVCVITRWQQLAHSVANVISATYRSNAIYLTLIDFFFYNKQLYFIKSIMYILYWYHNWSYKNTN